jgi:hypothetical protein
MNKKAVAITAGVLGVGAIVTIIVLSKKGGTPTPPPTGKGYIVVNTTPSGASISINGTITGTSPGTLDVDPGTYNILVRLTGYNDATRTVSVVSNETKTLNITLTVKSGGGGGAVTLSFSCNQPAVTPDNAPLGTTVQIACPVVSYCSATVQARVRMQVAEASIWASPGTLLEEQVSAYQQIAPNQTRNFTFTHVTRGAVGSKDITIIIEVNDQEAPGGNHFDDAFHVTEAGGGGGGSQLSIQLGQPRVLPEPSVMGSMVDIFCPISFIGGQTGDVVMVKIHIAESSFLPWPGDELKVFSGNMVVAPGETQEILATWTTSGAHGSKDVTVEVYLANNLIESNHFDDAFHVT